MTHSTMDRPDTAAVTGQDLKEAMRAWKSGITIITTSGTQGMPVGLVSNSFTSVSLNPPLVSWCVDLNSSSIDTWSTTGAYSVHILADGQEEWISRFAARGTRKFHRLDVERSLVGTPVLDIRGTRMDCTLAQRHEAGDHLILVGQVHRIEMR
ncbi:flavin reductase family protein [Glutamicibacter sp. MNS18]|uniref:flavin reductase family protein n=1 Tax=Glutamicibacter sp. MNS18 TaxID=2989817 RepID=UPI002235FFAA|nr:flavin reductase family protein [Glutamicibacter sp. MNS18]MCW4465307.1 flavin reductase family protein [Glutamicibacter sp. MNS18]